jgi:hypothetical protein
MPQKTAKKSNRYSLKDTYQEDYKNKDKGGAKRIGYIDTSKAEDVEWYQIKEGKNELDIIPYIIKTDNHPQGREKGKADYKLDIWVHRGVGDQEAKVLCLRQTFNQPCPICEEIKKMIASENYTWKDKEIKDLQAKHREVYNVIDLMEDKPKIKLFDVNHFEFQKEIIEEAEAGGDGEFVTFAELDEGKTIVFRGTEREGKDFKNSFKPKSFKFVDRDPYDEDIIEEAYPLDALLIIPTYDQVKELLYGAPEKEDDEPDDKPAPTGRKPRVQKEEEDDEPAEDDEEDKPVKKKGKDEKNPCPAGGKFGKDCDELDECKKCKSWDECDEAQ